jgi:hypothetical protein
LRVASKPFGHLVANDICQTDPDVAAVNQAWPALREDVRQCIMIMMLVKAASRE